MDNDLKELLDIALYHLSCASHHLYQTNQLKLAGEVEDIYYTIIQQLTDNEREVIND